MEKIKVFLDTDMGSDCDDAGALSLLHRLADCGRVDILAVTHCASEIGGAVTIKCINEWFGRVNIPVGRYTEKVFLEDDVCKRYTSVISKEYLKTHTLPRFPEAVSVMREILSQEKDVTIISIGTLNNVYALLKSQADEISSLSGEELIKRSIKNMYVMGGDFADLSHGEYNILRDIRSAQYIAENFPKPIIYSGFETGIKVRTGRCFKNTGSPMEKIYSISTEDALRESWDPITVYCAIVKDSLLFDVKSNLEIGFNDDATVKYKTGGKDGFIIMNSEPEAVEKELDGLMY